MYALHPFVDTMYVVLPAHSPTRPPQAGLARYGTDYNVALKGVKVARSSHKSREVEALDSKT